MTGHYLPVSSLPSNVLQCVCVCHCAAGEGNRVECCSKNANMSLLVIQLEALTHWSTVVGGAAASLSIFPHCSFLFQFKFSFLLMVLNSGVNGVPHC